MNTSACRRATTEKTRKKVVVGIHFVYFDFFSLKKKNHTVVLLPVQPCNENMPKDFLFSTSTDKTKGLFFPPPLCSLCPSFYPHRLLSLLCVGRSSTLAVHVFTNVSEYLIVILPLSSALRRLSVSKADL